MSSTDLATDEEVGLTTTEALTTHYLDAETLIVVMAENNETTISRGEHARLTGAIMGLGPEEYKALDYAELRFEATILIGNRA